MRTHTKVILLLLVLAVAGYALWMSPPKIDTQGKIHANLYEGASGTWNPQVEVLPFTRVPQTMLTVKWQPPEETYNHFVMTISTSNGTLIRTESNSHDHLSMDLDGFEPQTEYLFDLQACLDPRCEAWLIAKDEYRGMTAQAQEEASLE